ncbi:MAG: S8 family peptidase [Prevotella sp.]|nr:S8 family peptidase [Prevotella sp.]
MTRLLLLLIVSMTVSTINAHTADRNKLSAWVRQVMTGDSIQARRAANQHSRLMTAFVQMDETLAGDVLTAHGCRTYAQIGDIRIATIPIAQLGALSQHPAVRRIEASPTGHTTLDTVPRVVNALPVYEATAAHPAFTGSGVVVGVMDVGFDLTHPTFYNDATLSRYRISAFWDQLSTDTIGSPFPVGRDFTGHDTILAAGCATDGATETHGTHTAGIAAGSGYDSPYRGLAYDSDICLVANAVTSDTIYISPDDRLKYTTATDALGFKYIFDYADSQGKPCVLSFSEGYTPHLDDDDRLFAEVMDKLSGPGHILVISAGNENQCLTYAEKPRGTDMAGCFMHCGKREATYRIMTDGPLTINVHGYGADGTMQQTLTFASTDERWDEGLSDTLHTEAGACAVSVTRHRAYSSDHTVYIVELTAERPLYELGYMALAVQGTDSHAEIFGSSSSQLAVHPDIDARWCAATKGRNILAPGCFPAAICVGATTWRTAFTNYAGQPIVATNQNRGLRMTESSTGPTMSGLMKPDVVAPGYFVTSAYSSFYRPGQPNDWAVRVFEHGERTYSWTPLSGTSMATPAVAGTIALWLQAKPTLTREEIIDVFSRTCRQPDNTLSYPNNEYGYGEIDAYRGLLDILGLTTVETLSQHQPAAVQMHVADGLLHLTFNRQPTAPLTVTVYTANGQLLSQTRLHPSSAQAQLPLDPLPPGIYAVQLQSAEPSLTGSNLIRIP